MAYNYPYGNGQQLNLDWFLNEWKNLLAAWEAEKNGIEGALQAEIDRAEAALADVFAARDAAAQSAANALESKNAAAQSATAAGNSANAAAQSETAAGNSASAAAQSETAAGNSANAAAQSETAAGNSASAAAQSETAAGNSANAAAQSETAAGNSATAAATSETNAAASAAAAARVEESIPEDYTTLSNDVTLMKNGNQVLNPTFFGDSYVNLISGYNHHRIIVDQNETTDAAVSVLVYYSDSTTQKIMRIGPISFSRGVKSCYEIDKIGNKYVCHAFAHYTDFDPSMLISDVKIYDIYFITDTIIRIGITTTNLENDNVTYFTF